ncbi:hypothetical protein GALMADRAFT_148106 [Galerina marginata CBS 339.88]|uniref:Uncharacterized protein n=1 Tax=Galerina marginata (strain CBS 339.88) TaxID=685588 RepID=A0A067S8E8_GALM3|nr:hypothetical protein GALMADRAFT_148106 [Galerina marginata CBS 339.88]
MHAKLKQRVTGLNAGLLPFIDLFSTAIPPSITTINPLIQPPSTVHRLQSAAYPSTLDDADADIFTETETTDCICSFTLDGGFSIAYEMLPLALHIGNHRQSRARLLPRGREAQVEKRRSRSAGRSGREEEEEIDHEEGEDERSGRGGIGKARFHFVAIQATMPKVTSEDYDLVQASNHSQGSQDAASQSNGEDDGLPLAEASKFEDLNPLDQDMHNRLFEYDGSDVDADEDVVWGGITVSKVQYVCGSAKESQADEDREAEEAQVVDVTDFCELRGLVWSVPACDKITHTILWKGMEHSEAKTLRLLRESHPVPIPVASILQCRR